MTTTNLPQDVINELSKIAPGEVCIFSSDSFLVIRGVADTLFGILRRDGMLEYHISVREQRSDFFAYHIAARKSIGDGDTSVVYFSTFRNLYGFCKEFWGIEDYYCGHFSGTETPDKIQIAGCPDDTTDSDTNPCFSCPLMDKENGIHLLSTKVPSQRLIEMKMESLLSDCLQYGYNIDFQALADRIKEEGANMDKYSLDLDYVIEPKIYSRHPVQYIDTITRCDIYVVTPGGKFKLDLTPIEKSIYLTYMSYDGGIPTWRINNAFIDRIKSIYNVMPDKVKNKTQGIMTKSNKDFSITTLTGHISNIRAAIQEHIKNSQLVNEFAIEGYKDEPFMVKRTPQKVKDFLADIDKMNTEPHKLS